MNILKTIVLIFVLGFAINWWQERHTTASQPGNNINDFISRNDPSGALFQSVNDFISKSDLSGASFQSDKSENGFISVFMPAATPPGTVLIVAPVNCPSDAAQRADYLEKELTQRHIPTLRSASDSTTLVDPTPEQQADIERLITVLKGPIPAVFINGRGKSNPSVDEVVAEYRNMQ